MCILALCCKFFTATLYPYPKSMSQTWSFPRYQQLLPIYSSSSAVYATSATSISGTEFSGKEPLQHASWFSLSELQQQINKLCHMETSMILHSNFMLSIHKTFIKLVQLITYSRSKIIHPEGLYAAERSSACAEFMQDQTFKNIL